MFERRGTGDLGRSGYRVGMAAGRRYALIGLAAADRLVSVHPRLLGAPTIVGLRPRRSRLPRSSHRLRSRSRSLDCQSLFDSAPRDDSPSARVEGAAGRKAGAGVPARAQCVLVHDQARIVFGLDTAVFVVAIGAFVWMMTTLQATLDLARTRCGLQTSSKRALPSRSSTAGAA